VDRVDVDKLVGRADIDQVLRQSPWTRCSTSRREPGATEST